MSWKKRILWGAIGGACPIIAKFGSYFSTNWGAPMPELGAYLGLALFVILGAIVAHVFDAQNAKAAVLAGIAAPGFVTNLVAGQDVLVENPRQEYSSLKSTQSGFVLAFGIGTAHARSPEPKADALQSGSSKLSITVRMDPRGQRLPQYLVDKVPSVRVDAVVGKDNSAKTVFLGSISLGGENKQFKVPKDTKSVVFLDRKFDVKSLKGPLEGLQVTTMVEPARDFLWTLGLSRKFRLEVRNIQPRYETATPSNSVEEKTKK